MKNYFSIGEMAELFSMNIRTLRYYDDIGILHPEYTDPVTGYRYYSTKQFERLNTIKYLRALNMSLKNISVFFENRDVEVLQKLLEEQRESTRAQIAVLQEIEKKLDARLESLEDAKHTEVENIVIRHINKRNIVFLRREISLTEDLEYPIRELEKANGLKPMMFLGKVGVSIAEKDLVRRKFDHFSGIFVFVENEDSFDGEQQFLPEGDYAVIRFRGTHKEAAVYYRRLLDYIQKQNLRCAADSVEVTLIDAGFTNDTDKYLTEIQIRVVNTWVPAETR